MNYTIECTGDPQILIVKIRGDFTIADVRQWSVDVAQRSRASGVRRLLFDVRSARNTCGTLDTYRNAYHETEELNLPRNVRSAILVSENDRSHDFAATTLSNAGIDVELFADEQAAWTWLMAATD